MLKPLRTKPVRTCRFLEFRECGFVDVVVDLEDVGVVPDEQEVAHVGVRLVVLPECQAVPAQREGEPHARDASTTPSAEAPEAKPWGATASGTVGSA